MTYLYFVFLFSIEMLTVLVRCSVPGLSKFTGFPHKSHILSSSNCVRRNFSSVGKF